MNAAQVIAEIDALPEQERARVIAHLHRLDESEIPESFRRGMAQALAGEGVEMETALNETPPSRRG